MCHKRNILRIIENVSLMESLSYYAVINKYLRILRVSRSQSFWRGQVTTLARGLTQDIGIIFLKEVLVSSVSPRSLWGKQSSAARCVQWVMLVADIWSVVVQYCEFELFLVGAIFVCFVVIPALNKTYILLGLKNGLRVLIYFWYF